MSALASELPMVDTGHIYDATAYLFSAKLQQPFQQEVVKQALVNLPEKGGYKYEAADPLQLKGIASYRGGYTQVAGHHGCNGPGATTLATAVIEDVNVLDVVTADRLVAQIITEHPADGRVPSVSFLGSRFENLRIAGEKIEIEPHLDILGPKPDDDGSYFDDGGVFSRIAHQYANIKRMIGLPKWASDQFNWDPAEAQHQNQINCSLVSGVSGSPGKSFGHVIEVPHFGKIFLAELTVNRTSVSAGLRLETLTAEEEYKYRFTLTMMRVELDCPACGTVTFAVADPNGQGQLPPPKPKLPGPPPPVKKSPQDRS
jgi:hypothetical protein